MSGDRNISVQILAQVQGADQVSALNTQLKETSSAVGSMGNVANEASNKIGHMAGATSTAAREFRALFDEFSAGRYRMIPGTLAIILQRVFGFGPATLLAIAGVGGLAGALGYLQYAAIQAQQAMSHIALGAELTSGIQMSDDAIMKATQTVADFGDTWESTASASIAALTQIKTSGSDLYTALGVASNTYAEITGTDADKIREEWIKAFNDPQKNIVEFVSLMHGEYDPALVEAAAKAREHGDANQQQAIMLQAVDEEIKRLGDSLTTQKTKVDASFSSWLGYVSGVIAGETPQEHMTELIAETNAKLQKEHDLISGVINLFHQLIPSRVAVAEGADQAAAAEDHYSGRIATTKAHIEELKRAIDLAHATGGLVRPEWITGLKEAEINLQELNRQMEHHGVHHGALGPDIVAMTKTQIAQMGEDVSQGNRKILESQIATWQALLDGDKLNAKQRNEVARDLATAKTALAKLEQKEQREIDLTITQGKVERGKLELEAEKQTLEEEFQSGQITANKKYQTAVDYTNKIMQLDLEALNAEETLYAQDSVEFARIEQQKLTLATKLNLDLAQLARQHLSDVRSEAQQEVQVWKEAFSQIDSAAGTLTRDLISNRKNLAQDLLQITEQFVSKEISADMKYFLMHLLLSKQQLAADKGSEEAGFLFKLLFGQKSVAADAANAVADQATATAAAAANIAVNKATAAAIIPVDAAETFAGVFANLAPVMGPAAAGPAGAAAAVVLAQLASVAAAGGIWDTGSDNLIGFLHPRESVLPANIAGPMRDFFSGGGSNSGGGDNVTINIHAIDTQTGVQFLRNNIATIVASMNMQRRLGNKNMRQFN